MTPILAALAMLTVIDGDTLDLDGQRWRLKGIDAPEMREDGGKSAKAALRRLTAGQDVWCEFSYLDRYERNVGVCYAGVVDLGAEMIRRGFACRWGKYDPEGRYRGLGCER